MKIFRCKNHYWFKFEISFEILWDF